MVDKIILRQRRVCEQSLIRILSYDQFLSVAFEGSKKNFVILRGQQFKDIAVIFL